MAPVARATCALSLLGTGLALAQAAPPADLEALLAATMPGHRPAAWCAMALAPGEAPAYAVAISTPQDGGRYLVIARNDRSTVLGSYAGPADLSCHSAARAEALNETIARSATVHGGVRPRGPSTVVCGFVEPARALCWQYAPEARAFVQVGEWTT